MKKATISNITLTQIFYLVITALIIIGTFKACNNTNKEPNIEQINKAFEELTKNDVTNAIITLEDKQFGIFFRADMDYFAQIVLEGWSSGIYDARTGKSEYNPPSDALISPAVLSDDEVVKVFKPDICFGNNCFCTMKSDKSNFLSEEIRIAGKTYNKQIIVKTKDVNCKIINNIPAKYYYLKTKSFNVKINDPANPNNILSVDREQKIINVGGTLLAPLHSSILTFYFNKGNEQTGGFFVCKHEDECNSINFPNNP